MFNVYHKPVYKYLLYIFTYRYILFKQFYVPALNLLYCCNQTVPILSLKVQMFCCLPTCLPLGHFRMH